MYNAEPWLNECLKSVLQQDFEGTMELSVFNDASQVFTTSGVIEDWRERCQTAAKKVPELWTLFSGQVYGHHREVEGEAGRRWDPGGCWRTQFPFSPGR